MFKLITVLWIATFSTAVFSADASKLMTVDVDKHPALQMQLQDGWTAKSNADMTEIKAAKFEVHVELWNVAKAKNVAAATSLVPDFIKGEVAEFKPVASKDIKVAGSAAKHIIGTGTEADDGDPSNAEVFLFSVGGKVFLICAHGEGAGAAKVHDSIVKMLATAKKP